MSKGSKSRITDFKKYQEGWERIYGTKQKIQKRTINDSVPNEQVHEDTERAGQ